MAHGDARVGKWRGNWRKQWVASTLHTTSDHGVSSITTTDAHTSAASSRLNWRRPTDLNGLLRFAERRNLVSARVPSHFDWPLTLLYQYFILKYILEYFKILYWNCTISKGYNFIDTVTFQQCIFTHGDRGSTVVKVLCYKSEGCCFDPRWCHWNFSLT